MNNIPVSSPDEVRRKIEVAFDRHKHGDIRFAAEIYLQVLAHVPDHPLALHYLGLIAQQTGDSKQAVRLLRRSIEIDRSDPRTHNHLGQVYVALNDKRAAVDSFERALQIDPEHVASLNNLANVIKARDLLKAISLYRRALELNPNAAFAAFNLAQALDEDNAFDDALIYYRRAIELDPKHLQARHNLAVLLEQRGHFPEAIDQYLVVQRHHPRHVASLANAVSIRDYLPDLQMVRRAEEMLRATGAQDEDRIKLHRGLGKHYERAGAYGQAYDHFAEAKSILKRSRPRFDIGAVGRSVDRSMRLFGRELFAGARAKISTSQRLVFIVGLPRSGTTLCEQILASHPQVFGAGELQGIPKIVNLLRPDYPECLVSMSVDALAELANDYLHEVNKIAGSHPLRITDKMPVNSLHLGLIRMLFPDARVIYCRRDPLDVAISCFVELFELEHDYTTSLEDFGRYFLEHERLMTHWRAVLPVPMYELRYERLVADTVATSRELVAYCGLEWDPACLEFQRTERTVQTPSRWQVRQPIYRSSIGRWRNYRQHVAPLQRLLNDSGFHYTEAAAPGQPGEHSTSNQCTATAEHIPGLRSYRGERKWTAVPPSLECPIFIVAAPRSGSTLLFETLAHSEHLCTVGGEAHWLVENISDLRPGAPGVESNRLTAEHFTEYHRDFIIDQIADRLVDNAGKVVDASNNRVFLEKTPKNALRIPFFDLVFPRARFVFLWRDPRENISSIMEAWRSGLFKTYKKVADFDGPWSLLLPPGYRRLRGAPVEDLAAFQWDCTNRIILQDLEGLDADRWVAVHYKDLVVDPLRTVTQILGHLNVVVDSKLGDSLRRPLPHSRYTYTAPADEKWRMNEAALERVLPQVVDTWTRLRELKSIAPRPAVHES